MPTPTRRRWFQFGLRTMFVVVTLMAMVAYWFARPTILANRFVQLMEAHEYDQVDEMFRQSASDVPWNLWRWPDLDHSKTTLMIEPLTVSQFVSRERRVRVGLTTIGGTTTDCAVIASPGGLRLKWSGALGISL